MGDQSDPQVLIRLRAAVIASVVAAGISAVPAGATILTFNSNAPAENATTRDSWLAAAGIATPQFLVDFETGYTAGQNIHGSVHAAGMVINDTGPGTPTVEIRSAAGSIGSSNPVGSFSATHDEAAYLELDFAGNPVDYVGFQDIDTSATSVIVTFVGGGTASFSLETTGTGGDSAEFVGIFRNDMPQITLVQLDANGDGRWGIDTIEYGVVPEPGSIMLLGMVLSALLPRRNRCPSVT